MQSFIYTIGDLNGNDNPTEEKRKSVVFNTELTTNYCQRRSNNPISSLCSTPKYNVSIFKVDRV